MSKEVKRYYVQPSGPEYLVEMTDAYRAETGFAGLIKGEDYDALLAEREMLKAALDDIGGLSRALRQGGPDPMDLEGLSNALEEAVDIAHDAISALQGAQP